MFRTFILCLVVLLLSSGAGWMAAQDERTTALDLPAVGLGLKSQDDREGPQVTSFYDIEFEGDAFFWCLDQSGSMGWNGEIQTLKIETNSAIRDLSPESEFGIVSFASNSMKWRSLPQVASYANRTAARAWVTALGVGGCGGLTCLKDAVIATLDISNLSSKKHKRIILLSDGLPTCGNSEEEILGGVTAANGQQTPIDCVYISSDANGIEFMQELASRNQGSFYHVSGD